jgi:cytidyltransferase-like protein
MNYIVLGRFQPLHNGHALLIEKALDLSVEGDTVTVAIGSASCLMEPRNPWTGEERKEMIEAWSNKVNIVLIDDINDPPNWVEHASKFHGAGTLVTSDEDTAELYRSSNWPVIDVKLENRENFEGWRIRQTIKMLSTVDDFEAVREVLSATLPAEIIDWLIEKDALYRLSTFQTGVYAG